MSISKTKFVCTALILLVSVSCKSRHNSSTVSADKAGAGKIDHGQSMGSVDYALESELVGQVGARIGCEEVADSFAVPSAAAANGDLKSALNSIQQPATDYAKIRSLLFMKAEAAAQCQSKVGGKSSFGDGFDSLATRSYEDQGRTVLVIVGGFGAEFGASRPLASSIEKWRAKNKDAIIWQIHCEQSFAADDQCQLDLAKKIAKNESTLPNGVKPHYVFWAYSRGGTGLFATLNNDKNLRSKTSAVIFAATPFAGVLTPILAARGAAAVQQSYNNLMKAAGARLALTDQQQQALSFLMTMLAPVIENNVPSDIKSALQQVPGTNDFMANYSPEKRRAVVEAIGKSSSWAAESRSAIPVYFLSGTVDLPRLRPIPSMAVRQGSLTIADPSFDFNSLRTVLFSPLFREFPLSDGVVAMEHSLIPNAMLPGGIEGHLAGLLTKDHQQLALVGKGADAALDEAIADGMLAVIAQRLRGEKL